MNRRAFFALTLPGLAIGLAGQPGLAASPAVRRIGVLCQDDGDWAKRNLPILSSELDALGLRQGRDYVMEVCAAEARNISVPECAAELARARYDLIFTQNTQNTRALQKATQKIPVVTGVGDPVGSGFAASLAKPGGNITGLSFGTPESQMKLMELSRRLVPRWTSGVHLADAYGASTHLGENAERAGRPAGTTTRQVVVASVAEVERLFRSMRERGEQVAFVPDIYLGSDGDWRKVAELAIRYRIALFSLWVEWVRAGALLSFSADYGNVWARQASQIALILRGADPATTPFEMPERTEVALNRATAKALRIRIPDDVLTMATEIVG